MVYKGLKPVHWCTYDQSALAEAEVEYADHTSPSVYVRFRLTDESVKSLDLPIEKPCYAVIWTTTPWTLPANLAIAFKPDFDYDVVEHDGENFIIASELVKSVAPKFGWTDYRVVKVFKGSRSEEHTSELQSRQYLVCRLLLEKKQHSRRTVMKRGIEPHLRTVVYIGV